MRTRIERFNYIRHSNVIVQSLWILLAEKILLLFSAIFPVCSIIEMCKNFIARNEIKTFESDIKWEKDVGSYNLNTHSLDLLIYLFEHQHNYVLTPA